MGIGNILGSVAPIAAGYFLPGSATLFGSQVGAQIAAGAATGAGIAALSGNDVLGGAVTGGLGGMSGGSLASAAQGAKAAAQGTLTDAAANELVAKQAIQQGGTNIGSGLTGSTGQLGANLGQVNTAAGTTYTAGGGSGLTGGTINQAYRPDFMATTSANMPVSEAAFGTDYGIKDIAGQLGKNAETGELNPVLGAGKMGITGLGVAGGAGAFDPKPIKLGEEDKYDPNARLDLSRDTGISKYLNKDTGLRLLAQGGQVQKFNMGGMYNFAPPPKYGVIDVGGKFVETSKKPGPGLISDKEYKSQYETTAKKDQQQSSGDMSMGLGPKEKEDDIDAGAAATIAAAFAQQQTNPPYKDQTLGLSSLAKGGKVKGYLGGGVASAAPGGLGNDTRQIGGVASAAPGGLGNDTRNMGMPAGLGNTVGVKVSGGPDAKAIGTALNLITGKQEPVYAPLGLSQLAEGGYLGSRDPHFQESGYGASRLDSLSRGYEYYANGGYLETGGEVGDGMSDEIPATIEGEQEARLSDGEFVIPADVVSHLGNGSSDAGAKRLYEMMDKIRMARTGTKKQGKEINPERYMPA